MAGVYTFKCFVGVFLYYVGVLLLHFYIPCYYLYLYRKLEPDSLADEKSDNFQGIIQLYSVIKSY